MENFFWLFSMIFPCLAYKILDVRNATVWLKLHSRAMSFYYSSSFQTLVTLEHIRFAYSKIGHLFVVLLTIQKKLLEWFLLMQFFTIFCYFSKLCLLIHFIQLCNGNMPISLSNTLFIYFNVMYCQECIMTIMGPPKD